eukprot:TRINITY_DN50371_c0_g1_i1.p1 TRINITY_DN50371_c0_g1~~TRINITY_DN50371_c0_g1_i1.p1  ORF type:complete len:156 (+),score=23.74 TRINITY_DN50371_c0_g1_i1:42-509(+)
MVERRHGVLPLHHREMNQAELDAYWIGDPLPLQHRPDPTRRHSFAYVSDTHQDITPDFAEWPTPQQRAEDGQGDFGDASQIIEDPSTRSSSGSGASLPDASLQVALDSSAQALARGRSGSSASQLQSAPRDDAPGSRAHAAEEGSSSSARPAELT